MGVFVFFGVCVLLAAKLMLLSKILWTRDCTGISGKTQVLYGIIFAARYLDIVTTYYTCPIIVSLSRIAFTALTYCIVLSIYFFYHESYQSKYDKFRIELLILPCIVLSLLANYGFDIVEVFWAFSVYLECVAILPQVYMISRAKHVENIVYYYISVLSLHKILVLMEAIYRFYVNERYDKISLAAGIVQLMFYCDFFTRDVPLRGELRGSGRSAEDELEAGEIDEDAAARRAAKEAEAAKSAVQAGHEEKARHHASLGEIVLTPAELVKDEKTTIVTPEETEAKTTTSDSAVRA